MHHEVDHPLAPGRRCCRRTHPGHYGRQHVGVWLPVGHGTVGAHRRLLGRHLHGSRSGGFCAQLAQGSSRAVDWRRQEQYVWGFVLAVPTPSRVSMGYMGQASCSERRHARVPLDEDERGVRDLVADHVGRP